MQSSLLRRHLRAGALAWLILLGACQGGATRRAATPTATPDPRPTLVVDIDDTLVSTPAGALCALAPFRLTRAAPLLGAPAALGRLSRDYRLVYLTARGSFVARGTLRWLDAWGFPRAPVIFSDRILCGGRRHEAFKTRALRGLQAEGHDIRWGIGDKLHDVRAYLAVGARPLLLADCADDPDAVELRRCLPGVAERALLADPCGVWSLVLEVVEQGNGEGPGP